MATPKSPAPAAIATPAAATLPEAPLKAQATPAAPAKLPARKKAAAQKIAVQQVSPQASAPARAPIRAAAKAPGRAAPAPAEKTRKPKLVRDNFTMPKAEYAALDALKQRAALLSRPTKKNELLRAGLQLLTALPDTRFLAALARVPSLKADRDGFETKK
ncbi:MAG: hypothetical protein M3R45_03125 [Pseudomonadota bacterium]|nr:hypothetical protein [Pseudomonadota bacterium]